MNFANILHQIAQTDPEVYERISPRRRIIANWMPKAALATLPLALGTLFNKAYGKTADVVVVIDTLNFALKLEYLESKFYATALAKSNLIPANNLAAIQLISANESAHRDFVYKTIETLGGDPIKEPTFDFTGGNGTGTGPFFDVFSNYTTFLAVAQSFEETGVRAYKGGAPNLVSHNDVLQAALQIHSVEGRHAAMLRKLRKDNGHTIAKPWVTQAQSGIATMPTGPTWAGEDNTIQTVEEGKIQTAVQITGIAPGISSDAASEAFDEPLTRVEVEAIADPFIVF